LVLSQRAGRLMNTPIMRKLQRDIKELTAFQQAIETVGHHGKFEDLDQKWQDLIISAEQQKSDYLK
jgi:hypothetical protein